MKSYSEIKQEEAGTLNRNLFIQYLYKCGYRQVDIAKKFGHSRQWAHQIVHRTYPKKIGFWERLFKKLWYWSFGEDY